MKIQTAKIVLSFFILIFSTGCAWPGGLFLLLGSSGSNNPLLLLPMGGTDNTENNTNGENVQSPSLVTPVVPSSYPQNIAITPITFNNSGSALTNCIVSPSLPAGLTINTSDCTISGTPTAVTPSATYTIAATNSSGSSSVTIDFAIVSSAVTPSLSVPPYSSSYNINTSIVPIAFTNSGSALTNCTVSPSLPTGLTINTSDCTISGTPTAVTPSATYTITATNSAGNDTASLTFDITAVDTLAPTITNVTSSTLDGTINIAGIVAIQIVFSEAVNVDTTGGTPTLALNSGGSASYSSGTGTNTLNFTYTVASGQSSADLDYSAINSLVLNGGTIKDSSQNNANLTLASPGASGSLGINKAIAIYTSVPTGLTYPSIPSSYTQNFAIAAITPSALSGTVTGCISSPALPAGLILNSTTCEITGTPTVTATSTAYTITPSNANGNGNTAIITFAVIAAPTISFASASSSSTDETTGNTTVTLTLSAASAQTVTVLVRDLGTGTAAPGGVDYTNIGTSLLVSFSPGNTSATFNIGILNDSLYEGNETINLDIHTPSNGVIGGQTTHTFTITDDEVGIISAETMDCNNNGKIDHYKIILSAAISDSTFPGYNLNALGSITSDWLVAGRTNVRLHHGTAVGSVCSGVTDTSDDLTLYLVFDEAISTDTGAKPDLTTTATPGLTNGGSFTMSQIFTASVAEADRAKPVITSANGTASQTTLTLTFSEAVYGVTGAPACGSGGNVITSNLLFTDGNTSGATSISSMGSDTCAVSDSNVTVTMNTAFVAGDSSDTIAATISLYDAANLTGNTTSKTLTIGAGANPTITSIEEFDVNGNGNIDQLKITFSLNMADSTISNSEAAQFTVAGTSAVKVDATTHGSAAGGTILSPNTDPGTTNDTVVTVFTDDLAVTGTSIKAVSFTEAAGKWLSGSTLLQTISDLTTVTTDKAPPVILTAVATAVDTNPGIQNADKLVVTFSEPTDKSITAANISSILTLSASHSWGGISSVNWNTNGDIMTVTFNGSGSPNIAVGDYITIVNTLADIAPSPNTSTNKVSVTSISGSFGLDSTAPYMLYTSDITSTSLMVQFSEPMLSETDCVAGANKGKAYNCMANYTLAEETANACTDVVIQSLTILSNNSVRLNLDPSKPLCNITYRLTVASTVSDAAITPNAMGSPRSLTFVGLEPLRVVVAQALTINTIKLSFNKPAYAGINVAGSAECNTTTECAKRYKISPLIGDGTISSASLSTDQSSVTLTHNGNQGGIAYTVIAANGRDGDGFDNGSNKIDGATGGTNTMQATPNDRGTFIGSGVACDTLACGAFYDDPFQDGSTFSFAFEYDNKVYLGTNDKNNGAFRFEPSGIHSILTTFEFVNNAAISLSCAIATGFGYITTGITTSPVCGTNSGGNGEVGVASFNSIDLVVSTVNYELLLTGTLKNSIDTVYYTQDKDSVLDMKSFGITGTNGINSKSTQTLYGSNDKVFVGIASDHATNAPILNRSTATASGGIITIGTPSDLTGKNIDYLGCAGTNKNPNCGGVVGIDLIYKESSTTYLANNSALVYLATSTLESTTSTAKSDWNIGGTNGLTLSTPSSITGSSLYMPDSLITTGGGLGKVRPGQKAYPFIVKFKGDLYLARNVGTVVDKKLNLRGEVWRCTPNGSGQCAPSDWSRIITGEETELGGTTPTHKAVSMLQTNGSNTLYIGFDGNSINGAQVFRFKSDGSSKPTASTSSTALETTGSGCTTGTDQTSCWDKQGTYGLASSSDYIITSVSVYDTAVGLNYLYLIIGDGLNIGAIKVSRQTDSN